MRKEATYYEIDKRYYLGKQEATCSTAACASGVQLQLVQAMCIGSLCGRRPEDYKGVMTTHQRKILRLRE